MGMAESSDPGYRYNFSVSTLSNWRCSKFNLSPDTVSGLSKNAVSTSGREHFGSVSVKEISYSIWGVEKTTRFNPLGSGQLAPLLSKISLLGSSEEDLF